VIFCLSFPFLLSANSSHGMQLKVFCVLFAFQTINYGDSLTSFPHHFFVPTTMESSTPKTNVSVQVEPNALCVVGRLARCSNNNIVNGSKQEVPSATWRGKRSSGDLTRRFQTHGPLKWTTTNLFIWSRDR
jgi:hypothetical protein